MVPFDERRLLAARRSPAHGSCRSRARATILVPGGPAWRPFFDEVRAFLAETSSASGDRGVPARSIAPARDPALDTLQRPGARGDAVRRRRRKSNAEIADAPVPSPRTVERHLSNVYAKLGIEGKAAPSRRGRPGLSSGAALIG